MGDQYQDIINQYFELLNDFHKEDVLATEDEDMFSCAGCPLRPTCTGHVSNTMITTLINSVFYNLDHVFIIHFTPRLYQLIVINYNEVLLDEYYETLCKAKQAFLFKFSDQFPAKGIQPDWSSYFPCSDWLEEKLMLLDACQNRMIS